MKTAFIIAEYNPFHNGHHYQISEIKKRLGQDTAIVAVMSGNFVQRGGPAILDKWARAQMALSCGVDLVIELPCIFAASSAELFALGGVMTSAATGICDHLVFGSESGDISKLQGLAEILADEPAGFKKKLHESLAEGKSFARARSDALADHLSDQSAAEIISKSNNILAIEYLKAIYSGDLKKIKPLTIKREGSSYNDTEMGSNGFSSASAIRAFLDSPDIDSTKIMKTLSKSMPVSSLAILTEYYRSGEYIFSQEAFASEIFAMLISLPEEYIQSIAGMEEGLGNRFKRIALRNDFMDKHLQSLIDAAVCKRYPRSRIRRALTALLLGIQAKDGDTPYYLRILGFTKKGRYLLKIMRKKASLPVITRASDFKEFPNSNENKKLLRTAQIDITATDIWTQKTGGVTGRDFNTPPISFRR